MARRRLGVALVLDPPAADEVDGLRRALGDHALGRIVPHLTLISPVNVRREDLGPALSLLRDAAAAVPGPLDVVLGPPTTFLPANPVLYLPVSGDVEGVARLRAILFVEPLARRLTWPWIPHVTLADDAPIERITAATGVLDAYRVHVGFERVVLLEERHGDAGRRWVPLADALLGPRVIVGRGGLPLELTTGRVLDPEARALLDGLPADHRPRHWPEVDGAAVWSGPASSGAGGEQGGGEVGQRSVRGEHAPFPLFVVGRQEGAVVGVGAAWQEAGRSYLAVAAASGQDVDRHILARIESHLAEAGWDGELLDR
jgi:2'-5' RNA ligase